MEKIQNDEIKTFADNHNIESRILKNYLDCVEMGDYDNADIYYSIMMENSLDSLKKDFEKKVKSFSKSYFQNKK